VGENYDLNFFTIVGCSTARHVFNRLRHVESHMTPLRSTTDFSVAAPIAAIALVIALVITPTWARADIQVRGTPEAVVVEAQNATVEEILVALTDAFKVRSRSAANLDKRLTGTYEGTLQHAVSRILKGYNFVMKSGPSGLEITLLGAGKPVAVVSARSKSAEAVPAATPTPTTTADNPDHPVHVPSSGGPDAPDWVATGPVPVLGAAPGPGPSPMPPLGPVPQVGSQVGSGPVLSPMPPRPGEAPESPMPTASSAVPPSPRPSTSALLGPPTSSAPVPSAPATVPPLPSPTR
jgi:hypothetical protein